MILPHEQLAAEAVIAEAAEVARGRGAVFLYRGKLRREWVGEVWRTISPKETIVTPEDQGMMPPVALDRVRRHHSAGTTVLHLVTSHVMRAPEAVVR